MLANFNFNNDIDFNDFDLGGLEINNTVDYSANFGFEDAPNLKGAEISLGPHETSQETNTVTSSLSQLPPLRL